MSAAALSPLIFHAVLWTLVLLVAVGTYLYAVSTRKRMTCASCGETIKMEHDTVRSCPSCGAPLT